VQTKTPLRLLENKQERVRLEGIAAKSEPMTAAPKVSTPPTNATSSAWSTPSRPSPPLSSSLFSPPPPTGYSSDIEQIQIELAFVSSQLSELNLRHEEVCKNKLCNIGHQFM
jgi:hypothetical protein